ncbi:phosphonate metabolism protein/1,5-bisphosphokinase (PRPP-forming) PhnN [Marinibacterium profundimaris]|uniref:Ribose 1,5-bisphosphate phosphokinase PhnN n=1 Tax=Marinibacterium profundimaris TaxID=1679460 RepID=A0A225NK15_9RHOB|nr:phosphonate metabolism protein/1,5-bisphosphokinase (PRPP-forming) PhnN [Marinibacterium profundimaris]OWU69511.1 ribose-phosphate pyrophosphokinase [Marinibacterium profundimaris]
MSQGRLVAVVGPSGVGKDSVMAALVEADPAWMLARRVITRPSEAGGEDFEGVSEEAFRARDAAGEFLLSWEAHGLHYGVPRAIEQDLAAGRTVLVNLSRAVLLQAQTLRPDLQVISLTAPPEVLAARLSGRGREAEDEQKRRLSRGSLPLPEGLAQVHRIDNSGALDDTVAAVRAALQPESV